MLLEGETLAFGKYDAVFGMLCNAGDGSLEAGAASRVRGRSAVRDDMVMVLV